MANVQCRACFKEFGSDSSLHRHLKAHKMTQAYYYQKYEPRYDKFDGKIILFKNRDYYFSNDFNSKQNLNKWLNRVSRDEAKDYIRSYLLQRKLRKNLKYAPCQVELRSLMLPGMVYLNKLFGNYYKECQALGLSARFVGGKLSDTPRSFLPHHGIYCDSREQQPLKFNIKSILQGLTFGDYRLNDDEFTQNCCIERKALTDLFGTLSTGYERFCREIERAQAAGFYLVVVVESSMQSINDHIKMLRSKFVYISPEYVFHNLRAICQNYDNVQFLFVNDRAEAVEAIERIFQSNGEFKKVDLQFCYDTGKLI